MYFLDDPSNPWIKAAAWNNTIEVQNNLMEGIGSYNTKGVAIWNNSVIGSDGYDGIGLWNATQNTVIGNNVSAFTVDSTGYAQIYLNSLTTDDLVVCAERTDTVLNQGTNNTIIGCQQAVATPAAATESMAPAASASKPMIPRGKPGPTSRKRYIANLKPLGKPERLFLCMCLVDMDLWHGRR